jgi:hypothetical protein
MVKMYDVVKVKLVNGIKHYAVLKDSIENTTGMHDFGVNYEIKK